MVFNFGSSKEILEESIPQLVDGGAHLVGVGAQHGDASLCFLLCPLAFAFFLQ
ncbi:MAG: hypothetical protein NHB14_15455 [Desulfosporosinus sp.]|nr:hypothetical protein [Desulfosporosinus sp.]